MGILFYSVLNVVVFNVLKNEQLVRVDSRVEADGYSLTPQGISMKLMPRLSEADESTRDQVVSYEAGESVLGCF